MDTVRYPDPRYASRSTKTEKSQNTNPLNDKTTIAEAEVSQKQEKGTRARLNNVLCNREAVLITKHFYFQAKLEKILKKAKELPTISKKIPKQKLKTIRAKLKNLIKTLRLHKFQRHKSKFHSQHKHIFWTCTLNILSTLIYKTCRVIYVHYSEKCFSNTQTFLKC